MTKLLTFPLIFVLIVSACITGVKLLPVPLVHASGTCNLTSPALCETFDSPGPVVTNSGQLNGVLWGVSRATSLNNTGQGQFMQWADVSENVCGTQVVENAQNAPQICNGRFVEGVNDNGGQTVLAAYPRQPFDIAGRTGTVSFDVSNNTQGAHAAWPALVYTDQPVPAPYFSNAQTPGITESARNAVGISFADLCGAGSLCGPNVPPGGASGTCFTVDQLWINVNYNVIPLNFSNDGCANEALDPNGPLNTIQAQFSTSGVTVFAGDPGSSSLRQIAHVNAQTDPNFVMPLTRGLVWIEDVHYNGNKFETQQSNTFSWDNVGFDGPVLTQDRGFDVLEGTAPDSPAENGLPTFDIGWEATTSGSPVLNTLPVDSTSLNNASGAILTFVFEPQSENVPSVSINGNSYIATAWPFHATSQSPDTYVNETIAVPVPLSEVVSGVNTVELKTADSAGTVFGSIDLILIGGGGSGPTPTPTTAPTATPTAAPTATPTVGPTATPTTAPTATPTAAPTATPTVGPTATPTSVPTATPTPASFVFGQTTIGTITDAGDGGYINGSKFVSGNQSGSAQSISVYIASADAGAQFQLAIYTNRNGSPGTLVGHTTSGTIVPNSWNTLPISGNITANTTYWLLYETNDANYNQGNMVYDNTGTYYYTQESFGTWPTLLGSGQKGIGQFSIYVTY